MRIRPTGSRRLAGEPAAVGPNRQRSQPPGERSSLLLRSRIAERSSILLNLKIKEPDYHDFYPTHVKTSHHVRLTQEDEAALQVVQTQLRPKYPWLNRADLVRAALHEAAIALAGSGIVG
jgi:hypothetical protein